MGGGKVGISPSAPVPAIPLSPNKPLRSSLRPPVSLRRHQRSSVTQRFLIPPPLESLTVAPEPNREVIGYLARPSTFYPPSPPPDSAVSRGCRPLCSSTTCRGAEVILLLRGQPGQTGVYFSENTQFTLPSAGLPLRRFTRVALKYRGDLSLLPCCPPSFLNRELIKGNCRRPASQRSDESTGVVTVPVVLLSA